jgi:hypothetical protein
MNTNNSISSTIKQLLEINVNSLKTFERINEAVTTSEKNVPLEILNADGTTTTVYVPSFGFMKRELERLDTNLKAISGLGVGDTNIRLSDGTYQKVITSSLKTPASNIESLNRPVEFNVKTISVSSTLIADIKFARVYEPSVIVIVDESISNTVLLLDEFK